MNLRKSLFLTIFTVWGSFFRDFRKQMGQKWAKIEEEFRGSFGVSRNWDGFGAKMVKMVKKPEKPEFTEFYQKNKEYFFLFFLFFRENRGKYPILEGIIPCFWTLFLTYGRIRVQRLGINYLFLALFFQGSKTGS